MKFRAVRNGYDPAEVEEYIKRLRGVYDKTLLNQRDRIFELRDSLSEAESKIAAFEKEKSMVGKSIESAIEKADEIKSVAKSKYADEISSLREFHEVWVQYFSRIITQYPLDSELRNMGNMGERINSILAEAEEYIPMDANKFNPISMIQTHLEAETLDTDTDEADIFDYDSALNPDEDLQSILGDLGIKHS